MAARLTLTQEVEVQALGSVPGARSARGVHLLSKQGTSGFESRCERHLYSSVVKLAITPDCLSGDRGFEPRRNCHGPLV